MKVKNFREIQVSSSQLALIFLLLLAVAIVIFWLGVSVGKKQVLGQAEAQVSQVEASPASASPAIVSPESLSAAKTETKVEPEKPLIKEEVTKKEPEETKSSSILGEKTSSTEAKTLAKPLGKQAPTPQLQASTSLRYFVQVGAFAHKEGASSLIKELKKIGYQPVIIEPLPTDKKALYRVRIGPFPSLEAAVQARDRVRASIPAAAKAFLVRD
jgi:cell division septation protein DedD